MPSYLIAFPKNWGFLLMIGLSFGAVPAKALPGFFDLGGLAALMLSPQDSISLYRKVEITRQNLEVYLERRQAFLRAEYHLQNRSQDTLRFKLMVPVNVSLTHPDLYVLQFRNVDSLEVWLDSLLVKPEIFALSPSDMEPGSGPLQMMEWQTLPIEIYPGTSRVLRLYAQVKTDRAYLREGYGREAGGGLAFCLSTASPWYGSIGQGYWRITLSKEIHLNDIQALFPDSRFHYQAATRELIYRFQDLRPKPEDDLIIRYAAGSAIPGQDTTGAYRSQIFTTLDSLHAQGLPPLNPEVTSLQNLEVHDWKSSPSFFWAMFVMIFGLPVIVVMVGLITVWRRMRKAKKNGR